MWEGSWVTLYVKKICHSSPRASLSLSPCQLTAKLQTRHRNQGIPASRLCLSETHSHTLCQQPAAGWDTMAALWGGTLLTHLCSSGSFGWVSVNTRGPSSSWNAIGTAVPIFTWFPWGLVHGYTHDFKAFFTREKCGSPRLLKQEHNPQSQPSS